MRIFGLRKKTLDYLRKLLPNIPEYVLVDFVYNNYKNDPKELDETQLQKLRSIKWKLKTLELSLDSFEAETKRRLEERASSLGDWMGVSKDQARHQKQKELLERKVHDFMVKEPLIALAVGSKLELLEGWHRTIQALKLSPEGFKANIWVGTPTVEDPKLLAARKLLAAAKILVR